MSVGIDLKKVLTDDSVVKTRSSHSWNWYGNLNLILKTLSYGSQQRLCVKSLIFHQNVYHPKREKKTDIVS